MENIPTINPLRQCRTSGFFAKSSAVLCSYGKDEYHNIIASSIIVIQLTESLMSTLGLCLSNNSTIVNAPFSAAVIRAVLLSSYKKVRNNARVYNIIFMVI